MITPATTGANAMSLATSIATDHQVSQPAKRTRKTRADKGTEAIKGPKVGKLAKGATKVSFYLSPEVIRRLKITAVALSTDTSEVLENVLAESAMLRRFVLSDRAKVADQATVEVSSD
jgi:hypothetical protein